jgi:hypothetical protein
MVFALIVEVPTSKTSAPVATQVSILETFILVPISAENGAGTIRAGRPVDSALQPSTYRERF